MRDAKGASVVQRAADDVLKAAAERSEPVAARPPFVSQTVGTPNIFSKRFLTPKSRKFVDFPELIAYFLNGFIICRILSDR